MSNATYTQADQALLKNYHEEIGLTLGTGLTTYLPGGAAKSLGELRGQRIIHEAVQRAKASGKRQSIPSWARDWYLDFYEAEMGSTTDYLLLSK